MGDVPLSAIALDASDVEYPQDLYEAYVVVPIPPHRIRSILDLETCASFPPDFQP